MTAKIAMGHSLRTAPPASQLAAYLTCSLRCAGLSVPKVSTQIQCLVSAQSVMSVSAALPASIGQPTRQSTAHLANTVLTTRAQTPHATPVAPAPSTRMLGTTAATVATRPA